jgi:hypothetical protein
VAVSADVPAPPSRPWRLESRPDGVLQLIAAPPQQSAGMAGLPSPASERVDAADPGDSGPPRGAEWLVGAGGAWSMRILQAAGGRGYVPVFASWAHDVTRDRGRGALRGRLAWGAEVLPLYLQYRPTSTVGAAVLPLVWRWRLIPRRGVVPFGELAFGGLFTRDAVPEGTVSSNFLAYGGVGVRLRPARRVGAVIGYRFHHISNGNTRPLNPGVNANVLWVGLSVAPPR